MTLKRRSDVPRLHLEDRDYDVFESAFMHRMLNVQQFDAIVGSGKPYSEKYLSARLKLLVDTGYLVHPEVEYLVTNKRLYSITSRGVSELESERPHLPVRPRHWEKRVENIYIKHLRDLNDFMICIKLATARAGVGFSWAGNGNKEKMKFVFPERDGVKRSAIVSDTSPFDLKRDGKTATHAVEIDRNSRRKGHTWCRRKYERYFDYYRATGEIMRVLIVCPDPDHRDFVWQAIWKIGRTPEHNKSWPFFMLTDARKYSLDQPERVLNRIFYRLDRKEPVSLLD